MFNIVENNVVNICKVIISIVDEIAEEMAEAHDRQQQIKLFLFSLLGTIIGLHAYNSINEFEKTTQR